MDYKTKQEAFWAGSFGDDYSQRNIGPKLVASNVALFARMLSRTVGITSVVEFGANIGLSLRAVRQLLPEVALEAVEINHTAACSLREWGGCEVREISIFDYQAKQPFDLSFTKGVLIHISPEHLSRAYDTLFASSRRYILMVEYYNPVPVEVSYRGHQDILFKRDFGGEFLDRFPSVTLVDYGFVYRRDQHLPKDDLTWFLFEKRG